jgi:hypothetical protein
VPAIGFVVVMLILSSTLKNSEGRRREDLENKVAVMIERQAIVVQSVHLTKRGTGYTGIALTEIGNLTVILTKTDSGYQVEVNARNLFFRL